MVRRIERLLKLGRGDLGRCSLLFSCLFLILGGSLAPWPSAQAQNPPPAPPSAPAQAGPPAHVWLNSEGQPLPFKTDEEVIEFLRTAKAGKVRGIPRGITGPRRVSLEKDGVKVNAAFRTFEEKKDVARLANGQTQMFFRDSYMFEPAAYEVSRLLGLDNVPPAIERRLFGEKGSLQIFVEQIMHEDERQKQKIAPPDPIRWNRQVQTMRLFDNLIYNFDRNMGNILIDRNWKLWMIDHSRSFSRLEDLVAPQAIVHVNRKLWAAILALDRAETERRLKPFLRKREIEAIFKRREKLVALVNKLVAERGEADVFFDPD